MDPDYSPALDKIAFVSTQSVSADKTDVQEVWLANLSGEARKVKITGFDGPARLHRLSDGNFQTLAMKPDYLASAGEAVKKVSAIELGPYGAVRIRTA